jgi:hypothetical protein
MARLCVAPIVEGQGDAKSVQILLRRIGDHFIEHQAIIALEPSPHARGSLLKPLSKGSRPRVDSRGLERALEYARLKLTKGRVLADRNLILVLVDAETSDPEEAQRIEADLRERACTIETEIDVLCLTIVRHYETWFVASAESLAGRLDLSKSGPIPDNPEERGSGKKWIKGRFKGPKYDEVVDQMEMTKLVDLDLCRRRSSSFDKLCWELELRARAGGRMTRDSSE